MLVIDRELILPTDCLLVAAQEAGVELPSGLAPSPLWRNPDEVRAHRDEVRQQLADVGAWRAGRPTEVFLRTITVLGRAAVEFSATVESSSVGSYHLHVAASGRDAVLAATCPARGRSFSARPGRRPWPRT